MTTDYLLDNAWQLARRRLALLEKIHDPGTIRRLEQAGVGAGWRVLVPGAGSGSIVRWLCERVGPTGRVVATDIDTRFLDEIEAPNLEVRQHDVARDELPEGSFDLVAVRLLLIHVPKREEVLPRLVRALAPGGRILIEEYDLFPAGASPNGAWAEMARLSIPMIRAHGSDYEWARYLPARLAALQLEEITAEVELPFFRGGSDVAEFHWLTGEQARSLVTDAPPDVRSAYERTQRELQDPSHWFLPPGMVVASARRPS